METPKGYCFSNAYSYVREHPGSTLIHGTALAPSLGKRVEHAWVELPDGTIWDGQLAEEVSQDFFERLEPVAEYRYTRDEALMAMLSHKEGTRMHTGPWEELRGCKGMTRKKHDYGDLIEVLETERVAVHSNQDEGYEENEQVLDSVIAKVRAGDSSLTPVEMRALNDTMDDASEMFRYAGTSRGSTYGSGRGDRISTREMFHMRAIGKRALAQSERLRASASRVSGKDLERALHKALTEVAESEPTPLMPFVEESEVPSGFVDLTPEYRFARYGPHSLVHIVKLASKGGGTLCSSRVKSIPVVDRTDVTFMSDRICPRCRQKYESLKD
jgi:hypothetical protein